jgi:hypothetical protein
MSATIRGMPRDIERWFAEEQRRSDARVRNCAAKRWFATEAEARAAALWDRTQFGERHKPYRCDLCDGWHLTSAQAPR